MKIKFQGEFYFHNGKINTKDDFFNSVIEKYDIDFQKKPEIYAFIVFKNYLSSLETNNIFLDKKIDYCYDKSVNNLVEIPYILLELKNLKILILNNNKITKIEYLENMNELERLELRGNLIKEFKGINNKKLKTLSLSANAINNINKEDLGLYNELEEFSLFGNFIGDNENLDNNRKILINVCSIFTEKMPKLKNIYLDGNYISEVDNYRKEVKDTIKSLIKIDGKII